MDDLEILMRLCSPWSWLLLAGLTMSVSILVERAVILGIQYHLDARALSAVLEKLVREGQLDRARKLAHATPGPWARVLTPGLEAMSGDPGCVRDVAAGGLLEAEALVWKRFPRLVIVALAVLAVGVLGSSHFLIQTPPETMVPIPLGLPLAWVPAASGAAMALAIIVVGGLLALKATRIVRDLRELPRLLERLAYQAKER